MSAIASLKNIDPMMYAINELLDKLSINVDEDTGCLVFEYDPFLSITFNDKILKLDLGAKNKHNDFTVFNPILREDHAQFLMTLGLCSQAFSNATTIDEEDATNFDIQSDMVFCENPDGTLSNIPSYISKIKRYANNKELTGVGFSEKQSLSITLAVVDYFVQAGIICGNTYDEIVEVLNEGYEDYKRLQELNISERKREMRKRGSVYNNFYVDDSYYNNYNTSTEEVVKVEEPIVVEDEPTQISDELFDKFYNAKRNEFVDDDIDAMELYGKEIVEESDEVIEVDGRNIVEEPVNNPMSNNIPQGNPYMYNAPNLMQYGYNMMPQNNCQMPNINFGNMYPQQNTMQPNMNNNMGMWICGRGNSNNYCNMY